MNETCPSTTVAPSPAPPSDRPAWRAWRPSGLTAFALALLLALTTAAPARADVVDRVVLRVNDRIATLLDYERRRNDTMQQLNASDMPEEQRAQVLAGLGNRIFRDMLEELLLLSRADQLRLFPTEEEVDRGVRAVRQQYGIASDDEFAAALASQGLSLAEFREQARQQLRMRDVVTREVTNEIDLEEDDLRRAYRANEARFRVADRYLVRELIVLEEGRSPEEVRAIAEAIRQELVEGRAFEDLAAAYAAEGTTSGLVDLGWVSAGELDPGLEAAIRELAPGEYSQPVPGRGGLHVIQLQERQEARVKSFGEVAAELAAEERQRLYLEKIGEYMRRLEESAYVRAEPPPEAAGFRTVAGDRGEEDPFADFEPADAAEPEAEPEIELDEERLSPDEPPVSD